MSLISQNVASKLKVEKDDKDLVLKEKIENGSMKGSEYDESRKKKRRRGKEKPMNEEEEKEMKKLENFLFGPLYSPVEFGKIDEFTVFYTFHHLLYFQTGPFQIGHCITLAVWISVLVAVSWLLVMLLGKLCYTSCITMTGLKEVVPNFAIDCVASCLSNLKFFGLCCVPN